MKKPLWSAGPLVALLGAGLIVGYMLMYAGKVLPGVSANGVYLSGLDRSSAIKLLEERAARFRAGQLTVQYGSTNLRIPVSQLDLKYDSSAAANLALGYGRSGGPLYQVVSAWRTLFSRPTNFSVYAYDDSKLAPFLKEVAADTDQAVSDASLSFQGAKVTVRPAKSGQRLDQGMLTLQINQRLSEQSTDAIGAPVHSIQPVVNDVALEQAKHQVDTYLASPIKLQSAGRVTTIDQAQIIEWINVTAPTVSHLSGLTLTGFYPTVSQARLELDRTKVAAYVANLAAAIDQPAQNAALTIENDHASVFRPSRDGSVLDQEAAVAAILDQLNRAGDNRIVALKIKVLIPDISEGNLNDLGIKELLSEGVTYFPGSTATRLINVRTGAAKFNGVLLKPGEVFSFGTIMGEVGPEQGYVPERVILGDHVEKQYGGGMCQVSSTAYRAALLAGLPILERVNHSYAVSYYTWPFGVQGVDATIYYPPVDLKFRNDTPGYILIQTIMQGVNLKFQFYGTKTKSGRIRGPFLVDGSTDFTKPSHSVFYRDVLDLAGNVTKTDAVNTWYKSSTDFPVVNELH